MLYRLRSQLTLNPKSKEITGARAVSTQMGTWGFVWFQIGHLEWSWESHEIILGNRRSCTHQEEAGTLRNENCTGFLVWPACLLTLMIRVWWDLADACAKASSSIYTALSSKSLCKDSKELPSSVTLSKALLHLSETPVPPPISALLIAIVCARDSCSWRDCTALDCNSSTHHHQRAPSLANPNSLAYAPRQ